MALFRFPSRLNFLLCLAAATVFEVLWKFPDVPNHAKVMMFVNPALIGGLAIPIGVLVAAMVAAWIRAIGPEEKNLCRW